MMIASFPLADDFRVVGPAGSTPAPGCQVPKQPQMTPNQLIPRVRKSMRL